jgi:hypothetical protein
VPRPHPFLFPNASGIDALLHPEGSHVCNSDAGIRYELSHSGRRYPPKRVNA